MTRWSSRRMNVVDCLRCLRSLAKIAVGERMETCPADSGDFCASESIGKLRWPSHDVLALRRRRRPGGRYLSTLLREGEFFQLKAVF